MVQSVRVFLTDKKEANIKRREQTRQEQVEMQRNGKIEEKNID